MERSLLSKPLGAAAVAVLLAAAACGGQDARPGSALETGPRTEYAVSEEGAVPPGQELSLMLTALRNTSDTPLVIRRIEPIGLTSSAEEDGPEESVRFELAPRSRSAPEVPLGFYFGPRPAVDSGASCTAQAVVAADGYVLEPDAAAAEDVFLVVSVRAGGPGTFRLGGQRVVYEQDGIRYRQDLEAALVVEVREGATPDVPDDQRACL